jgi:hypothetical protein
LQTDTLSDLNWTLTTLSEKAPRAHNHHDRQHHTTSSSRPRCEQVSPGSTPPTRSPPLLAVSPSVFVNLRWAQSSIGCGHRVPWFPATDSSSIRLTVPASAYPSAFRRALASQASLPALGMRPGRLVTVSTTDESTDAGSPVPTLRLALPAGPHFLPGVTGCTDGRLGTRPSRRSVSGWTRPVTSRGPVSGIDSSDMRSSPNPGQLARGVMTSRSSLIPVTPRFATMTTSHRHRGVAFPLCTGRGRGCTDHQMSQL